MEIILLQAQEYGAEPNLFSVTAVSWVVEHMLEWMNLLNWGSINHENGRKNKEKLAVQKIPNLRF